MDKRSFLLDLFDEVRSDSRWISPGVEEYFMVLSLIESGRYPIERFNDLAFLLETSWLKSYEQQGKFRELLNRRRDALLEFSSFILAKNSLADDDKKPALLKDTQNDASIPAKKEQKEDDKAQDQKGEAKSSGKEKPEPSDLDLAMDGVASEEALGEVQLETGTHSDVSFLIPERLIQLQSEKEGYSAVAEVYKTPFVFTDDYFPVKNRQLQQLWRMLKNKIEGNNSTDINFERTISRTAQKGYFTGFTFQKYLNNRFRLFILIDQGDAMIGVSEFGKELARSALDSQTHADFRPWFFSEVPSFDERFRDYLFTNEDRTRQKSLRQLFSGLVSKDILVVIYSEGGAFKGKMDENKIALMLEFLNFLKRHCGQSVWLNPAPRKRWVGTSAEFYARQIPMFDTSRKDLERSASTLKGKFLR
jgi:uncharacterized protein with von Willebrand factor type A (vWA) domain